MENNKNEKYLMSSVCNTLDVLDLLSQHNELGVAEISKLLEMSKASVFKMLYTLEYKNYVHKTDDAKYKLGIKFAQYGSMVMDRQNLFTLIRPFLKKLRDKHNETTHLGILDEDLNVTFMVKESSNASIQMASRVGSKLPFYVTGIGKVLVASKLDDNLINKIKNYKFERFTNNTVTDCNELLDLLTKVREQGYAQDLEEAEDGLVCFAAPIKDIQGDTIAAISISGPYVRMNVNKNILINSLIETANEASHAMGYSG